MEKPFRSRFRVENKHSNSFVDVEIVARRSNTDLKPLDEDAEEELTLEEIDFIQLSDLPPEIPEGEITSMIRGGEPSDWGRPPVPSSSESAMVLYPKPRTRQVIDEFETVISTLPSVSQAERSVSRRRLRRVFSYLVVAALSIVGTWLVVRGAGTPAGASEEVHQTVARSATIVAPAIPSAAPSTPVEVPPPDPPEETFGEVVMPSRATGAPATSTRKARRDTPSDAEEPRHRRSETPRPKAAVIEENIAPVPPDEAPEEEAVPEEVPEPIHAAVTAQGVEAAALDEPVEEEVPEAPSLEDTALPPPETATALSSALPSKNLVRSIMEGLAPEVRKCRGEVSGRVVVEIVVSGTTGRVISSRAVDPVEVGGTAGQCAASAVKGAEFPPFEKPQLTIKYPYHLD